MWLRLFLNWLHLFPIKLFKDLAYSEKEEKLLLDAFFHSDGVAKSLSDVITSSINKLEDKHIADTGFAW